MVAVGIIIAVVVGMTDNMNDKIKLQRLNSLSFWFIVIYLTIKSYLVALAAAVAAAANA